MGSKFFGLLVLGIVFLSIFSASALAASRELVKFSGDFDRTIKSDEAANFKITLENIALKNDEFEIKLSDISGWAAIFSEDKFDVSEGNAQTFDIRLEPSDLLEAKTYTFTLSAFNEGVEVATAILTVSISEDVTPIVLKSFQISERLYPGKTVPFTIELYNNNFEGEKDVKISVYSQILTEKFSVVKSFAGKETKTISGELEVVPFALAGEHLLFVRCSDGTSYTIGDKSVLIPEVGSMDVQDDVSLGFLKTVHTVKITNVANYALKDSYTLNTNGFARYFTFVKTPADRSGDGIYSYDVNLKAGEVKTVVYTVSYLPLALGVVLLLGLLIWAFSRKKCGVTKRLITTSDSDGKKLVKVSILVKNMSFQPLHDLEVFDQVPSSFKVVFRSTAMTPDVVKKHDTHTALTWKLDKLNRGETRLFSYYLKAGMRIVGRASLPAARVRAGKNSYYSNTVGLSGK